MTKLAVSDVGLVTVTLLMKIAVSLTTTRVDPGFTSKLVPLKVICAVDPRTALAGVIVVSVGDVWLTVNVTGLLSPSSVVTMTSYAPYKASGAIANVALSELSLT